MPSPAESGDAPFAAIFDLDGLLADTESFWSESARILLKRYQRTYDPSLKPRFLGRHPVEVATKMVDHYGLDMEPLALLAERMQILEALYVRGPVEPMPGAQELVRALKRLKIPMAVASASPEFLVDLVLTKIRLNRFISTRVSADSVKQGKPAPDLFLLAAERLGVPPGRCVVLEDAAAGVTAALRASMACVAVPESHTVPDSVASATLVKSSLREVTPAMLEELIRSSRP